MLEDAQIHLEAPGHWRVGVFPLVAMEMELVETITVGLTGLVQGLEGLLEDLAALGLLIISDRVEQHKVDMAGPAWVDLVVKLETVSLHLLKILFSFRQVQGTQDLFGDDWHLYMFTQDIHMQTHTH